MNDIERVLKQLKLIQAETAGHVFKTEAKGGRNARPVLTSTCACNWSSDQPARHGEASRRQWERHVGARA